MSDRLCGLIHHYPISEGWVLALVTIGDSLSITIVLLDIATLLSLGVNYVVTGIETPMLELFFYESNWNW